MTKQRLDQALVARGLADSRNRAQALISAGKVTIGGKLADKPSLLVACDTSISITAPDHPWVSRGGIKLAAALDYFEIDPHGLAGLDIGASTGGFTDVLLTRGARRVYAIDVGRQQLAAKIRADSRVVSLDRINARYLGRDHVPEPVDIIVCDVSFIGLEVVLPAVLALAAPCAIAVALIKPQFEVGPKAVGKGGVVRDLEAREAACNRIIGWIERQDGWTSLGLIESPITGPDGNHEYLVASRRHP